MEMVVVEDVYTTTARAKRGLLYLSLYEIVVAFIDRGYHGDREDLM